MLLFYTMRKTQVLLLTILAVAAVTLYSVNNTNLENDAFDAWKLKYNKRYSVKEEAYRLGVWFNNLAFVEAHNKRHAAGLETYEVEMNKFADMDTEEFKAKYLASSPVKSATTTTKCTGAQAPTVNLPDEIDWQDIGAVTIIKDQGQCDSSWAFSTTGSVEGAYFLSEGSLQQFSEQQLVDCSTSYGNQGCHGGLMNLSFFYIKDNGITLESNYPYEGVGSTCKYNVADKAWTISDCTEVTEDNEQSLLGAIAKNPVSVAIQANHLSFQLYKRGVYTGNCGANLDHGALAVGYGTLSGRKYFRVKNSWGRTWGIQGYILIERIGDGKGKCGIQMAASFPIA